MARTTKKKVEQEVEITPRKCIIHVVKSGETIQSIANQYGKRVQDVITDNGSSIHIGKQIRIY